MLARARGRCPGLQDYSNFICLFLWLFVHFVHVRKKKKSQFMLVCWWVDNKNGVPHGTELGPGGIFKTEICGLMAEMAEKCVALLFHHFCWQMYI